MISSGGGRSTGSSTVKTGVELGHWTVGAADLAASTALREDISVASMLRQLLLLLRVDLVCSGCRDLGT